MESSVSQPSSKVHAAARESVEAVVEPRADGGGHRGEIRSITPASGMPNSDLSSVPGAPPAPDGQDLQTLAKRVDRVERQNGWLKLAVLVFALGGGYALYDKVFPEGVLIQKTVLESKELKLIDADGNPRLFLRMYSRVPVLQLMDGHGKPRMSLGLRFDDTPFIDLSDRQGSTRATLEINEEDAAALRLYDEKGEISFKIN